MGVQKKLVSQEKTSCLRMLPEKLGSSGDNDPCSQLVGRETPCASSLLEALAEWFGGPQ